MHDEDSVHPDDALLHRALAATAEYVHDPAKKDMLLDFIMTAPPLSEWSCEQLIWLQELSTEIVSYARMARELDTLTGPAAPDSVPRDTRSPDTGPRT